MPTIQQLSSYAQTALASYAANLIANDDNLAKYTAAKVGMANVQATVFNNT